MGKFALLTHRLPGNPSGQSLVLARLLAGVDPTKYCVISLQRAASAAPANTYYLSSFSGWARSRTTSVPGSRATKPGLAKRAKALFALYRWLNQLVNNVALILAPVIIRTRAKQIRRILDDAECTTLVACSGELYNLPAAHLACQKANAALVVYLFDDFVHQMTGLRRLVARKFEAKVLPNACAVIVTNEVAVEEYRRRYGIEAVIVRNLPEDAKPGPDEQGQRYAFETGKLNIVYTGSVYSAHYDAFRNLVRAAETVPERPWWLHIFTDQPPLRLASEGIHGPVVQFRQYVPARQIPSILRAADLVFLPLSFAEQHREIVKTASPGKLSDYLAAGKAILVHAPEESFVSQYCRRHQCAVVVDQNDVGELRRVLQELANKPEWRETLGRKAAERAKTDFNPAAARETFLQVVQPGNYISVERVH